MKQKIKWDLLLVGAALVTSLKEKPASNLTCDPAAVQVLHLHREFKGDYSSGLLSLKTPSLPFSLSLFSGNRVTCRNKTKRYSNVKVKEQVSASVSRTVITHLAFFQCYRETGQEKCQAKLNTASNLGIFWRTTCWCTALKFTVVTEMGVIPMKK